MWITVPDVVANRTGTIQSWWRHYERVAAFGVPLAFVVQDGMTTADVPQNADVVFVGRIDCLEVAESSHVDGRVSRDGTGWFRGDKAQLAGLFRYLEQSAGAGRPQREFALS